MDQQENTTNGYLWDGASNPLPWPSHTDMVVSLAKDGQAIIDELDPVKAHLLHMAVGVSGEAAELLAAYFASDNSLDVVNVVEELGDLEFFLAGIRVTLNVGHANVVAHDYEVSSDVGIHEGSIPAIFLSIAAGNLLDVIKKHAIYGKPLAVEEALSYMVDVEAHMGSIRGALGFTRDQVLAVNGQKLGKRYVKGSYTNEAAIERADKVDTDANEAAARSSQ